MFKNLINKNSIKIKNLKLKIFLLLAVCYLLFAAPPANAASLSLAVDPPIIEINALPPATVTSSLNIQNKGDLPVILQILLKPFKAKGENGEPEYFNEPLSIFDKIQILDAGVPVQTVALDPQQQKSLNLSIELPQDTTISDYYFSIAFISTNSSPVASNSSINQVGITTNVLLSVGSPETPKASLEEFSSKFFFEKGPVPFTVRIKNSGTHLIKPTGEISIKNMFGQNIGKLNLTSVNVLSESIRAISNKDSLDFQNPKALWKENFILGFYTATLNISMSSGGPTFAKSIHFFAFPIVLLIIIAVAVIAAIVIVNRVRKYVNKNRTSI